MYSHQIEEYTNHPWVNKMNRFFAERFLESRKKGVQLEALSMYHPFMNTNIMVYSISHKLHPESAINGEAQGCSDGYSACNREPKL